MKLSIVIPAHNEQRNIGPCLDELGDCLGRENDVPFEIIVVDDNSRDGTCDVVTERMRADDRIRLVRRRPPCGFGRALRDGIDAVRGDVVVIYMADRSDDPADVIAYYRKIQEGYDCVYGSRFIRGSKVEKYPRVKLLVNRIVNRLVQLLFWTRFNDLTNAFKAYRTSVLRESGPYKASHFNITLELSLNALIRDYSIAQIPIRWSGRTWGSSNLRLREMGRKYLCTMLMLFFQRMLIADDLLAERLAVRGSRDTGFDNLDQRLRRLEELVASLDDSSLAESADSTALGSSLPVSSR
jgi:dolichol-phosphate mannosyltransferase